MTKHVGNFDIGPLPGASFGALVRFAGGAAAAIDAADANPEVLPRALDAAEGLLVLSGMQAITDEPALLVRLSRLFGSEVENYNFTLISPNFVHQSAPEIFIVSNIPPASVCVTSPMTTVFGSAIA